MSWSWERSFSEAERRGEAVRVGGGMVGAGMLKRLGAGTNGWTVRLRVDGKGGAWDECCGYDGSPAMSMMNVCSVLAGGGYPGGCNGVATTERPAACR